MSRKNWWKKLAAKTSTIDKLRAARNARQNVSNKVSATEPSNQEQQLNATVDSENNQKGKIASLASRLYQNETKDLPLVELKPAPKDKNFFGIREDELKSLKADIKRKGVLEPIIVRELPEQNNEAFKYEILAGHTRVEASRQLIKELEFELSQKQIANSSNHEINELQITINQLSKIKAIIANVNDDDEALEIILDTNFQQRKLTSTERAKCIYTKITLFKKKPEYQSLTKNKERHEAIRNMLMQGYGLAEKTAFRWTVIAEMSNKLFNFVLDNGLSIESAVRLAGLKLTDADIDELIELEEAAITNSKIAKLKKTMSIDEIKATLLEGSKMIVQKVRYSTRAVKSEDDLLNLVFVEKGMEKQFEEYILAFNGAYIVKNEARRPNKK